MPETSAKPTQTPRQPAYSTQDGSVSYLRSNNSVPNFFDKFSSFFTKKTAAGLVVLVLVIGVGAATIAVQRSTEFRQRADTSSAPQMKAFPTLPAFLSGGYPKVLNYKWISSNSIADSDAAVAAAGLENYAGIVVTVVQQNDISKAVRYKRLYPNNVVLHYFNANARSFGFDRFGPTLQETYPGYFLLNNYADITSAVSASDTEIPVADGDDNKFSVGDIALIWEPLGNDPFGKAEYVDVTAVSSNSITATRGSYGINAKSFSAGAKIAALVEASGPNIRHYNYADISPSNPSNGLRLNQWLAIWLANNLNEYFDGYEFDVASWWPRPTTNVNGDIKNLDCDVNGVIDYCNKNIGTPDQISSYGLGYQQFIANLRNEMERRFPGQEKIIAGDDPFRAVDNANGAEFENFPSGDNYDESSGALADLEFFMTRSKEPEISYSYTKKPTELYPYNLPSEQVAGTNKRNRFGLVASLLYGAFHTYAAENVQWLNYPWDEDGGVINADVTGLGKGYLGQPKGPAQRIERFASGDMITNPSFESNVNGWLMQTGINSQANLLRDATTAAPNQGSSSLKVNVSLIAADPKAASVKLRYTGLNMKSDSEYTAVFWAKSDSIKDIEIVLRKSDGSLMTAAERFKIDSVWRKYYINLETNSLSDSAAVLEFRLGRETGPYWVDGVGLYEGTAEILMREFDNGLAVLSGSRFSQTVDLGANFYKKIKGVQDPLVNDGSVVCNGETSCQLTVPPKDGIILLKVPTPTIPAGNTIFAVTIGLDGIGTTGDNANPGDSSGSNRNPARPSRNVRVEVFDGNDNPVANRPGTIIYNATSGKFTGNINMETLASGNYSVKVKSDGYLRRLIPGIQNVTLGQTYNVPSVNLVTGDINGDNAINILDYNILISCSIFNINPTVCNTEISYKLLADLDDNGVVNQFDYNLFLRELSVQNGD